MKLFMMLILLSAACWIFAVEACRGPDSTAGAKAQAVWQQHESIVAAAARGEKIDLNRFSEAVQFFYRLTGITVPGEHSTYIDWAPTKETSSALKPLRRWYNVNRDRLYWDETSESVQLRPLSH